MERKTEENNRKLVLEPFDTLFNRRDYAAAERYWSPHYIQHSAHIEPPVNWIAADIVRLQNGKLVEHWDVIEDEVTQEQSKSGLPMFGDKFPQ